LGSRTGDRVFAKLGHVSLLQEICLSLGFTYHFIPPRDLRSRREPRASMGRSGHALVAVTLCCVCGFVAGIDLDEVMAALPAEARALLSKQNAEVTKMTDTICACTLRRT
jgi:hypothetical protein